MLWTGIDINNEDVNVKKMRLILFFISIFENLNRMLLA